MKTKKYIVVLSLLAISFCKAATPNNSKSKPKVLSGRKVPSIEEWIKRHKEQQLKYSLHKLFKKDVKDPIHHDEACLALKETLKEVYSHKRKTRGCPLWDKKIFERHGFKAFVANNDMKRCNIYYYKDDLRYLYKICVNIAYRGNPVAFQLRVPKGRQMQKIIEEFGLDQLQVPFEELICLSDQEKVRNLPDLDQCFEFAVRSEKLDLKNRENTISFLSKKSYKEQEIIATQLVRLICLSGLGDIGWHNMHINRKNGKLVIVDTEPLYCSLMLDLKKEKNGYYEMPKSLEGLSRVEKMDVYKRYNQYRVTRDHLGEITLGKSIKDGLGELYKDTRNANLPVFAITFYNAFYFFFKEELEEKEGLEEKLYKSFKTKVILFGLVNKWLKKNGM